MDFECVRWRCLLLSSCPFLEAMMARTAAQSLALAAVLLLATGAEAYQEMYDRDHTLKAPFTGLGLFLFPWRDLKRSRSPHSPTKKMPTWRTATGTLAATPSSASTSTFD